MTPQDTPDLLAQQVARRRQALYGEATPPDLGGTGLWGLALSGGGLRSAVFCFGLLKALAQARVLNRFDLLSTVSGGGYIGAALGRLFDQASPAGHPGAPDARAVQDALAGADTRWFTWWLRANGRYLLPQRANGAVYALAIYLRNLLAIHVEVGMLGLLLGAALTLLNLGLWSSWPRLDPALHGWLQQWAWLPTLWGVLPVLSVLAIVCACAYWSVGEQPQRPGWRRERLLYLLCWSTVAAGGAAVWLGGTWPAWQRHYPWVAPTGLALGGMWIGGHLLALGVVQRRLAALRRQRGTPAPATGPAPDVQGAPGAGNQPAPPPWNEPGHAIGESVRRQLTRPLEWIARLSVAVVALGLLDRLAWYLVFEGGSVTLFSSALAVLGLGLRGALPRLLPGSGTQSPGWGRSLVTLGHLAGLALLAMLCVLWVCVAYALVIRYEAYRSGAQILAGESALAAVVLAASCLGYMLATGWNVEFLNLSSLHGFYRTRLVRAFLGAANGARFGGPSAGAPAGTAAASLATVLAPVQANGGPLHAVRREHALDDVPMADYAPHRHGGPVHLMTACANETRDRPDGLLNQDRQGQPLTVAPGGFVRLGLGAWQPSGGVSAQTLGGWMAVSGAALAPGLGSMTRTGIAVLTMLAGLRLGYWWDRSGMGGAALSVWQRGSWLRKSRLLAQEMLGWFDTRSDRYWYLSDGGHFENTGAYALLAEEARLIVVADCGADPRYAFADLENLVRKARIDLQARITFLRPRSEAGADGQAPDRMIGSLDELASADTEACIAVAQVRYRSGAEGVLVVVKPNLCHGLPVDLVNFKRDHPDFPQQSSTDQSFDEAQWESYFTLGEALGQRLTRGARLEQLGAGSATDALARHFEPDTSRQGSAAGSTARLPARIMSPAMTASLSAGAVATAALGAWQTLDTLHTEQNKADATRRGTLQQLVDAYASNTDPAKLLGATSSRLIGLAAAQDGRACDETDTAWFRRSVVGQCILRDTLQRCRDTQPTPLLCDLLDDDQVMNCLRDGPQPSGAGGRVRYWGVQEEWPAQPGDCGGTVAEQLQAEQLAGPVPPMRGGAVRQLPALSGPQHACQGITIFNQTYDTGSRDDVRRYRQRWRELGARVPPVVSVARDSSQAGRLLPKEPTAVTFVAHDLAAQACAEAIAQSLAPQPTQLRPLPDGMRAIPGTLEVRWPPAQP